MSDLSIFGQITYIRSERARSIRVRILGDGLKVSVPAGVSKDKAIDFLIREKEVILKKQEKIKTSESKVKIEEDKHINTLFFKIYTVRADRKDVFFTRREKELEIQIPTQVDINDKHIQEVCWRGIVYFLRKEAKNFLPQRTAYWAEQCGFNFKSVKIQSSKSRWGSCSREKNINLSLYLMLLPERLVDYVILHELCHTIELNHSDRFWQLMDKVTDGRSRHLKSEIKKYHIP